MIIDLENGKGLLQIGLSEVGSYFKFNTPTSIVWYDGYGSIAKFLSILPYNQEYRNEIADRINNSVYEDFTNRENEAYELIKPLLELFENGKYAFGFSTSENKSFFRYWDTSNWEDVKYQPWALEICKSTIKSEEEDFKNKYLLNRRHSESLLDFSTYNFYDGNYKALIATQPEESIVQERVNFYENEIQQGKRPFAIILSKTCRVSDEINGVIYEDDIYSADFVLDGHHKLLAYQRLNIYPPILSIEFYPEYKNNLEYDLEELKQLLYYWQYEHMVKKINNSH